MMKSEGYRKRQVYPIKFLKILFYSQGFIENKIKTFPLSHRFSLME